MAEETDAIAYENVDDVANPIAANRRNPGLRIDTAPIEVIANDPPAEEPQERVLEVLLRRHEVDKQQALQEFREGQVYSVQQPFSDTSAPIAIFAPNVYYDTTPQDHRINHYENRRNYNDQLALHLQREERRRQQLGTGDDSIIFPFKFLNLRPVQESIEVIAHWVEYFQLPPLTCLNARILDYESVLSISKNVLVELFSMERETRLQKLLTYINGPRNPPNLDANAVCTALATLIKFTLEIPLVQSRNSPFIFTNQLLYNILKCSKAKFFCDFILTCIHDPSAIKSLLSHSLLEETLLNEKPKFEFLERLINEPFMNPLVKTKPSIWTRAYRLLCDDSESTPADKEFQAMFQDNIIQDITTLNQMLTNNLNPEKFTRLFPPAVRDHFHGGVPGTGFRQLNRPPESYSFPSTGGPSDDLPDWNFMSPPERGTLLYSPEPRPPQPMNFIMPRIRVEQVQPDYYEQLLGINPNREADAPVSVRPPVPVPVLPPAPFIEPRRRRPHQQRSQQQRPTEPAINLQQERSPVQYEDGISENEFMRRMLPTTSEESEGNSVRANNSNEGSESGRQRLPWNRDRSPLPFARRPEDTRNIMDDLEEDFFEIGQQRQRRMQQALDDELARMSPEEDPIQQQPPAQDLLDDLQELDDLILNQPDQSDNESSPESEDHRGDAEGTGNEADTEEREIQDDNNHHSSESSSHGSNQEHGATELFDDILLGTEEHEVQETGDRGDQQQRANEPTESDFENQEKQDDSPEQEFNQDQEQGQGQEYIQEQEYDQQDDRQREDKYSEEDNQDLEDNQEREGDQDQEDSQEQEDDQDQNDNEEYEYNQEQEEGESSKSHSDGDHQEPNQGGLSSSSSRNSTQGLDEGGSNNGFDHDDGSNGNSSRNSTHGQDQDGSDSGSAHDGNSQEQDEGNSSRNSAQGQHDHGSNSGSSRNGTQGQGEGGSNNGSSRNSSTHGQDQGGSNNGSAHDGGSNGSSSRDSTDGQDESNASNGSTHEQNEDGSNSGSSDDGNQQQQTQDTNDDEDHGTSSTSSQQHQEESHETQAQEPHASGIPLNEDNDSRTSSATTTSTEDEQKSGEEQREVPRANQAAPRQRFWRLRQYIQSENRTLREATQFNGHNRLYNSLEDISRNQRWSDGTEYIGSEHLFDQLQQEAITQEPPSPEHISEVYQENPAGANSEPLSPSEDIIDFFAASSVPPRYIFVPPVRTIAQAAAEREAAERARNEGNAPGDAAQQQGSLNPAQPQGPLNNPTQPQGPRNPIQQDGTRIPVPTTRLPRIGRPMNVEQLNRALEEFDQSGQANEEDVANNLVLGDPEYAAALVNQEYPNNEAEENPVEMEVPGAAEDRICQDAPENPNNNDALQEEPNNNDAPQENNEEGNQEAPIDNAQNPDDSPSGSSSSGSSSSGAPPSGSSSSGSSSSGSSTSSRSNPHLPGVAPNVQVIDKNNYGNMIPALSRQRDNAILMELREQLAEVEKGLEVLFTDEKVNTYNNIHYLFVLGRIGFQHSTLFVHLQASIKKFHQSFNIMKSLQLEYELFYMVYQHIDFFDMFLNRANTLITRLEAADNVVTAEQVLKIKDVVENLERMIIAFQVVFDAYDEQLRVFSDVDKTGLLRLDLFNKINECHILADTFKQNHGHHWRATQRLL